MTRLEWITLATALGLASGCQPSGSTAVAVASGSPAPSSAAGLYRDIAREAGVDFRFTNGATGRHYLLETTGSGCAVFDYNGDGRPDLFFLSAGPLPGAPRSKSEPYNRLYRNEGAGKFTDVSAGSGLEDTGYSQGLAVGDVDADGDDDLFVTAFGKNHLFLNEGGTGRFRDVTKGAGLDDPGRGPRWSTSAAFGDYNNDGKLDLYVCRYAKWSRETDRPCKNPKGEPSYCSPELYEPETHALYRGDGNGRFTDVTQASGIAAAKGHGLGVAWLDYNGDGWEDIFVANDLTPYLLWRNNGNGSFTEVGSAVGVALGEMGQLLSGMGVAVRDYSGDGREDLFVTNFSGQMNALFRNEGKEVFTNVTMPSGIGAASFTKLAFGCEYLDFQRDSRPDLIVGNGHVNEDIAAYSQGVTYAQPKTLLDNRGDGTFVEVTEALGDLTIPHVTRGLATGDLNSDGHLDIVANNQEGPPEVLQYTGPDRGHWISFETRGRKSNPNGYHSRISVRAGGKTLQAEVRSGSSYCSHSQSRLYFGLGEATTVDEIRITWHGSRTTTTARNLAADTAYRVIEGSDPTPLPLPEAPR